MYTEAGLRSHMSFFVCIYLAVFIVLSVRSRPPCLSPRFITALALHSSVTPHLGCAPLAESTSGQERPLVLGGFKKTGGLLKRCD